MSSTEFLRDKYGNMVAQVSIDGSRSTIRDKYGLTRMVRSGHQLDAGSLRQPCRSRQFADHAARIGDKIAGVPSAGGVRLSPNPARPSPGRGSSPARTR
jgi:hypothetical protein